MRVPLPTRFKLSHTIVFVVAIFGLQQAAGSDVVFSLLYALFTILSVIAFNIAGGLAYPSGSFIFFYATLSAIVGLTYKAVLFERAESHLKQPILTMTFYCAFAALLSLLAYVTKRITPREGLLANFSVGQAMRKAALGAFLVGVFIQIITFVPSEQGSFLSVIRQINTFTVVAILLATFYEVTISGGRRSSNWIVWVSGLWTVFFGGVLGFSKQGWLTPPAAWLVAAITAGHNFSRKQLLAMVGVYLFFSAYLVPYSQIARINRADNPTLASDFDTASKFIFSLGSTRETFKANSTESAENIDELPHLYDQSHGFIDRLNMLAPDDALFAYTEEGNFEGLLPTYVAFANIVPHFIWANKPVFYTGNTYGREIGMIDEDDNTTGISFTPAADAYHQIGWYGLLVAAGVILLLFVVMDGLSGDVRKSPWGLLFTVVCAHYAPEGLLAGQVYVATYTAFGVVVVALLTRYVLPILSGVIMNTERTRVMKSHTVVLGQGGTLQAGRLRRTPPSTPGPTAAQEP